jgi:hypothetical protein
LTEIAIIRNPLLFPRILKIAINHRGSETGIVANVQPLKVQAINMVGPNTREKDITFSRLPDGTSSDLWRRKYKYGQLTHPFQQNILIQLQSLTYSLQ